MQIRLTRKLADCLDGIDVSQYRIGDLLDLSRREAEMLIAEGWASQMVDVVDGPCRSVTAEELRCIREQLESWSEQQNRHRAEDQLREELRDSRAVTINAKKEG